MNGKMSNGGWTEVKNFESLKNLDHQPMGPRHMPIPHLTAIEFFKERLQEHGIEITNERAIMSPDTYKLMYIADVKPADETTSEDFCFSVGFLNNNDRSRAFTGIAGTRVHMSSSQWYVSEGSFKTRHMQNVFSYLTERSANIYGRGPTGEVWKLENELFGLVDTCAQVLSDDPLFFFINSYTTGFQPAVLQNILGKTVAAKYGGIIDSQELCLPVRSGGVLPCGATGRWLAK